MKNLLLFSIFLLTTANIFAQLRVRKNSGNDTYIYVDNTVLFVEQEISLGRNTPGGNTEASIYLRNNGQLIQGSSNSNNRGRGQISVQQNTPVTNAYAYYYWCSPVGDSGYLTTGQGGGNKNFGVGLLYEPQPGTSETAAQQVATTSGLNGLTTSPITVSTRWLYTFESPGTEREGNYTAMGGGLNAPPGFGFTMKGVGEGNPGHDQVYEFRGRPNNGSFAIPVAAPSGGESQMTLTGNPYPSAIDLNKLFYDTGNEELNSIWYYDEDRTVPSHYYSTKPFGYGVWVPGDEDVDGDPSNGNNMGVYTSTPFKYYTSGGGSSPANTGTPSSDQNKRFAPIAQGFMFVGKNTFNPSADGFVNIRNSHRIFYKEGDPGSVFHKPVINNSSEETADRSTWTTGSSIASTNNRTPLMRLWAIFDKAVTRDMVIAFSDDATDGYDRGYDGLSAQDLHTDAYFPIGPDNDRLPYVINGTNYEPEKYIPIAFKIRNTSLVELRLVEEVNPPYERAYLYDSVENTYKQLNGTNIARVTLTLTPGTYDDRFFIFFRGNRRGLPVPDINSENALTTNVSFFQNNSIKQLEIRNPEAHSLKSASVYDMSGKLVISERNLGDNTNYSFYTGNLSSGVYLVKLITENDIVIDYKAVVHNK